MPTDKLEVENVAIADPFSELVPRVVDPSWKVMLPVGVLVPVVVTVAVKVTAEPELDGLELELS